MQQLTQSSRFLARASGWCGDARGAGPPRVCAGGGDVLCTTYLSAFRAMQGWSMRHGVCAWCQVPGERQPRAIGQQCGGRATVGLMCAGGISEDCEPGGIFCSAPGLGGLTVASRSHMMRGYVVICVCADTPVRRASCPLLATVEFSRWVLLFSSPCCLVGRRPSSCHMQTSFEARRHVCARTFTEARPTRGGAPVPRAAQPRRDR